MDIWKLKESIQSRRLKKVHKYWNRKCENVFNFIYMTAAWYSLTEVYSWKDLIIMYFEAILGRMCQRPFICITCKNTVLYNIKRCTFENRNRSVQQIVSKILNCQSYLRWYKKVSRNSSYYICREFFNKNVHLVLPKQLWWETHFFPFGRKTTDLIVGNKWSRDNLYAIKY